MAVWSWSVNDVLVLITWIVFIAVVCSSVFMYIIKPSPKKNTVYDVMAESRGLLQRSTPERTGTDIESTGPMVESETVALLAGRSQENANLRKAVAHNVSTVSSSSGVNSRSAAHSGAILTPNRSHHIANGHTLTGTLIEEQNASDRALIENLRSVLNLGMTITMHTADGPRQIKLFLVGTDLRWKSLNILSRKTYKLSLHDVVHVEKGKNTNVLKHPSLSTMDEDHCLSIVTATHTLDLEATTSVERNVLVEGFSKLRQTLNAHTML